ncbi:MAG: hypothetical protein HZB92_08465 [Euryarchaeota archaeon]|nr:hypothetical protein [Euryarchaeota archaeon]
MTRPVAHTYRKPSVVARTETIRLCGICLGEVKGGLPLAVCDCGKLYHVSCAFRVGSCVSCGTPMEERMRVEPGTAPSIEDRDIQATSTHDVSSHPQPPIMPIQAARGQRLSPSEKLALLEERLLTAHISEATYLRLKEKFEAEASLARQTEALEVEASFECPECGEPLDTDAVSCPKCGVRFAEDGQFACPECARILDASARSCECGVAFTDSDMEAACPLCGALQDAEADRCSGCGVEFSDDMEAEEFRCPECDREIDENAGSCECGAVFDRARGEGTAFLCPQCGADVGKDDQYCPGCGAQFSD